MTNAGEKLHGNNIFSIEEEQLLVGPLSVAQLEVRVRVMCVDVGGWDARKRD